MPIGPDLQESLARLGRVGAIIAPTAFHDTFLAEVLPLFPEATFYASPGLPTVGRKPSDLREAPASWREILDWERIAGMPKVNEYVFGASSGLPEMNMSKISYRRVADAVPEIRVRLAMSPD